MSASASELPSPLLDAYLSHPARSRTDELVDGDGPRRHAEGLAATIDAMGLAGLLAARAEAAGLVSDEGITYGAADSGVREPWLVDPLPLPLDASDWASLERGLTQRAVLLDAVLADLYSDRTLLRDRVLPPAAILAHPGFTRPADRIPAARRRQLVLTATDLAHDASGTWRVISDRTQAPAGAGYAMATRRIVSRVLAGLHRSSDLARLRGFFHAMTGALLDAAPGGSETPRVVLLSPGSASETSYDQGFLAAMLGFPLAEADDLVVSKGRVWLRAGDTLDPVDVILRRVDALLADPLEFRGNSEVGLPGMVETARRGAVTVVNPVGVGVLDNPALIAHLRPVAHALLGEDLLLDSPTTWWCGQEAELGHVLANLERLVVKPVARTGGPAVRYGWLLSAGERDDLARRIREEPWAWCGQEPIELSTAPVVTPTGLEPRRFVLRTFGVASGDDYEFLPGGLGRVAASTREHTVSSLAGTLAKDVWVPASAVEGSEPERVRPRLTLARESALPPRVAHTLMTIGRFAERAEGTARLVKVADDLAEDFSARPGSWGAAASARLVDAVARITRIERWYAESSLGYLTRVALDPRARGGVHHAARRLTSEAQEVRDLMSVDIWSVFSRLERTLASPPDEEDALQPLLADVLESLLAYAGIMAQSMVRDSSWAFLDAGSRLERARHTVSLLRHTMLEPAPGPTADLVADAVLRSGESIITHRRRAASGTGPATATESVRQLLVHDPANPRSVAHSLAALAADLRMVGDERLAGQADAILADVDALADAAPDDAAERLHQLAAALEGLGERIAARHFVRQATRRTAETWSTPRQVG
ncbi:circularly permuted type 2 ATP-grasp protein [Propionicimonas sp.]|uniref:circularly permuted type 2 ATP-grasp protein n=1 Tax=Propionicimonas sp. TaxID=1955623 RepID=UPI0039E3FE25